MISNRFDADRLNEPVAKHVRRDFARLHVDQCVSEALNSIRENPPEGRIVYLYVLDDAGRIRGVLPTRRLLLNPAETKLADIMIERVVTVREDATVFEACEFFTVHRLLAVPVVDREDRMTGVIDVDLYTEELADIEESQRNEDLFQLIGVRLAEARRGSAWTGFRVRYPWLLTNVVGGLMAAFITGMFEGELRRVVELALFIPIVLALAESVSVQSVSLALQVMHGTTPTWSSTVAAVRREIGVGALLGLGTGLLVAIVALVWLGDGMLALVLLLGISCAVAIAAVAGLTLPTLIRLLQRDPKVAAGPIALATADMVTLVLYFNLARWLLT